MDIPRQTGYHFFLGLLIAVIVLSILIFLPFLTPLVLAAAIAVVFTPVYRAFVKAFHFKDRSNIAALLTLIVIAVVVLTPLLIIAGKVYFEVQSVYGYLIDEGGHSEVVTALNSASERVTGMFSGIYPGYSLDFNSFSITDTVKRVLVWIFGNLDKIFSGLSSFILGSFIMLLATFYFLRDGRELKRQLIALSPLPDTDDEGILRKLERTIYSIFAGSIAVGVIQGILTGIGFAIFGVPAPALWGTVASVAALIPGVGTSLVIVPGIAYLFLTGSTGHAVGLLIWGALAVGLIDNFLGPIFVNKGVKIHPFLILLSVLGGLFMFGPIGFVLGPIVLAFLFALLEIYKTSFSSTKDRSVE